MGLDEYVKIYGNPNSSSSIKPVTDKIKNPKKMSYRNVRTIDEIYGLEKTIVVPKKFTRVMARDEHLLDEIARMAKFYKIIDIDTETTGLDPFQDKITDVIITIGEEETYSHNYFIPMTHVDKMDALIPGQLSVVRIKSWIEPILRDPSIGKGFFNAYFDCMMFWGDWGLEVENIAWDGHPASHVLNENERSRKLKDLYGKYLAEKETDPEIKALGVETYEEQFGKIRFYRVPLNVATCYGAKDGYMTRKLREFQKPYIDSIDRLANVYYNIELPLIPVLIDMRKEGIPLDLDRADELAEELTEYNEELKSVLDTTLGEINLNSPKQLSAKLFDELRLPDLYNRSTKKDALQDLADMGHPVAETILDYRANNKLLTTYLEKSPKMVSPRTGKVHCSFNAVGARTGRFSSSNPNLQNIPRKNKKIRTMFTAKPGHVLISADYSQIEPRILAHCSQDPTMLAAYRNGEDLYSSMAAEIYSEIEGTRLTPEDCGEGTKYRTNMKTILLGIMYDMTEVGLSRKLAIDKVDALRIIDSFYERFPGVARHIKDLKRFCKQKGYVETLYGRKRRIPDIYSEIFWIRKKAARTVLNSEIQGTAADIMKLSMLEVWKDHRFNELLGYLLLTVHDENIAGAPVETGIEAAKRLVIDMEKVWELDVPIEVDAEIFYDRRWYGKSVFLKERDGVWLIEKDGRGISEEEFQELYRRENE
jgi:DNA polymerase-1